MIVTEILSKVSVFCINIISFLGYFGVFILMTFESMILPFPSELVMPFVGYLVSKGEMNLILAVVFSSLGSLVGSLLSYYAGKFGGKSLILKYGKWLLLNEEHLSKTENWFNKKGEKTVFISRFIPVVRHLISIPAGIGKMNIKRFLVYTVLGATIWNSFLLYLGYILGSNWSRVREYSEGISIFVAIVLVIGIVWFVVKRFRKA